METLLVVEDEPSLRIDLVHYLMAKGYAVHDAGTVADSRALLATLPAIDAIILDVGLPDGDGFDLLSEIRANRGLGCGVIMLTAFGDADDRVRGLDGGADAYLVKRSSLREIEATVRSVLRRLAPAPSTTTATEAVPPASTWTLDTSAWHLRSPGGQEIKLTGMEMGFLALLAEHAGRVCPRSAIAESRGRANKGDDRNIDALVNRLRRKIEAQTGTDAPIKVVYGAGYTFTAALACEGAAVP